MTDGFRRGVRLGIDVGKARVGVARSDPDGLLATPVETVTRDLGGDADIRAIAVIAEELGAVELVVGLPRRVIISCHRAVSLPLRRAHRAL